MIDENRNNLLTRSVIFLPHQEIMDVEHLWQYSENDRLNQASHTTTSDNKKTAPSATTPSSPSSASASYCDPPPAPSNATSPASSSSQNGSEPSPNVIANLCNVADHRLYKIVKWCKSLPLFKHISVSSFFKLRIGIFDHNIMGSFVCFQIDDQICLLINSWCELLLFSCCYRSIDTPGEVRVSFGKSISLAQAKLNGLHVCTNQHENDSNNFNK